MLNLPLALKYRPSTFSAVIGQEQVVKAISSALDSKQIHHAYLFSGPRGCGKTSSARILARSLNCVQGPTATPCEECQSCKDLISNGPGSLDVIEMDAATHGLVDDARELRDKALFAPVSSRYKIYIIDEAHQLGPAAANALLKIVEEPPPYVVFIFATTEPEKVIPTIRSRTHHYQFKLVGPEVLASHLQKVCELEKVSLEEGVLQLAVRAGNGSVRDSLSALGQLINGADSGLVSYEMALRLLAQTSNTVLDVTIRALIAGEAAELIETVNRLIENGSDVRRFTTDLLDRMRDLMVLGASEDSNVNLLRSYSDSQLAQLRDSARSLPINTLISMTEVVSDHLVKLRTTSVPQITLETMMMRLLVLATNPQIKSPGVQTVVSSSVQPKVEMPSPTQADSVPATTKAAPKGVTQHPKVPLVDIATLQSNWSRVLENIKNRRRLTWTLLSSQSQPISFDAGVAKISLPSAGALESFERSNSAGVLEEAMKEIFHGEFSIEMILRGAPTQSHAKVPEVAIEDSVDQISGEALLMKELGAQVISKEAE